MQKNAVTKNRDHFLRELLKNEFQRRAEKNPSFSLRAFSSKLEMDQSLLSKLLQGKRKFSQDNAQKISEFLGVYIGKESQEIADSNIDYQLMKEDEFFVISAWYHFAIIELIKTKNFKHSPAFVAQRLGITDLEAERALERLERLNFIEFKKNKYDIKKTSNTWLNLTETSKARKNLQKQMQEKSLDAIEEFSFDKREHSSLMVAVDPKFLPEVKKKITDFRRSLDQYIMEHGNEKEVYSLNVSFFPLTKNTKTKD